MDNYGAILTAAFHALADPTRRAVVERLGTGPATVTELAEPFDMALPSFMKHVRVLEEAGLVRSIKVGRIRTCTLDQDKLLAAERWFAEQRTLWASRYDNLDHLLHQLQGENHDH